MTNKKSSSKSNSPIQVKTFSIHTIRIIQSSVSSSQKSIVSSVSGKLRK